MEVKFERTDGPDDPDRCQGIVKSGQCPFKRVPPSKFCRMHGANHGLENAQKEEIRNYQLAKWQAKMIDKAENPKVKSLREEIGILRMTLETVIQRCKDDEELLMFSNKISDLVMKIEKVVASCHRLETSTGQLLDRTLALNFASQIVNIVSEIIPDPEIIDTISGRLLDALTHLQKDEK